MDHNDGLATWAYGLHVAQKLGRVLPIHEKPALRKENHEFFNQKRGQFSQTNGQFYQPKFKTIYPRVCLF